jgi:phosphohistidine phosphatase
MLLHLIRHAKTNQFSPTGKDYDRQLMTRGWNQCQELDVFLSNVSLSETEVICSGAARTRETLEGIKANFEPDYIGFTDDIYLCSLKDYLKIIWSKTGQNDLVFIGHNFGISDLANYFLDSQFELKTAEYMCIEFPFDSWELAFQSTGILKNRFRPSAE